MKLGDIFHYTSDMEIMDIFLFSRLELDYLQPRTAHEVYYSVVDLLTANYVGTYNFSGKNDNFLVLY